MTASDNRRQPLVSFIVTCYNLPTDMLCECIDSILALTMAPSEREIIVVDDGSDVSPVNTLMKYGSSVVYIRQFHQGLSEARNAGIQASTAQYLQFVDGDDRLLSIPYGRRPPTTIAYFLYLTDTASVSCDLPALRW